MEMRRYGIWLVKTGGDQIDVTMDAVAYLHVSKDHTAICFIGGRTAEGKAMRVKKA